MAYYDLAGSRVRYYISATTTGSHWNQHTQYRARADVSTADYPTYVAVTITPAMVYGKQKWGPALNKSGTFYLAAAGSYVAGYPRACSLVTNNYDVAQSTTTTTLQAVTYYAYKTTAAQTLGIALSWAPTSGPVTVASGDSYSIENVNDYSTGTGTSGSATSQGAISFSIPALASYTLSYNANGGSGAPGAQTIYYGQQFTTSATIPTRSGYTFRGWSTSSSGSVQYAANTTYTESNHTDLTLYAIWHKNPTLKSYSVNSSGTYYKDAASKQYTVTIGAPILSDSASVRSIVLSLGAAGSKSTTGAGTLSITPSKTGTYTPTITITDNLGAATTYTLGAITVKENTAPVCTITVTSSANYYGGYSNYSVNIDKATVYNDKTIKSIVLTVSNSSWTKTASRTNVGSLSVALNAVNTNTTTNAKVVITDNIGASTPYNLSAITVYPNTTPSATYTTSSAPYFGGVSTYTAKINATAGVKSIVETKVTLTNGATVLTKTGSNNTTLSIPLPSVEANTTYTVNLEATDSNGLKWQQSLNSITVFPNTPPTCEPTTNSGYFYVGISAKPYIVNTHEITTSNGKTVKEVRLILGSQYVTRTTAGELNIVPSAPLNQEIPRLIITDNQNASTEYSLPAVTVYSNTVPSIETITVNSEYDYYENTPDAAPTDYIVTLSGIQFYNNKILKSITLTLGNQTDTITSINNNSATLSIRPNTQSSNLVPIITITDTFPEEENLSNIVCSTNTFNPTNNNALQNITVNNRLLNSANHMVKRISETTGKSLDDGTKAVFIVTINYSNYVANINQNTTYYNKLLTPTVTVTDGNNTNLPASVTWYTNWSANEGFSGEINWTDFHPNSPITIYGFIHSFIEDDSPQDFDTNKSYSISFTPDSLAKASTILVSTTTLSQAFYLLVGKAGGHALGIGKKPSADGMLDVGMRRIVMNDYESNQPSISYRTSNNSIIDTIQFTNNGGLKINGNIYIELATSDELYTTLDDLGWTDDSIGIIV